MDRPPTPSFFDWLTMQSQLCAPYRGADAHFGQRRETPICPSPGDLTFRGQHICICWNFRSLCPGIRGVGWQPTGWALPDFISDQVRGRQSPCGCALLTPQGWRISAHCRIQPSQCAFNPFTCRAASAAVASCGAFARCAVLFTDAAGLRVGIPSCHPARGNPNFRKSVRRAGLMR